MFERSSAALSDHFGYWRSDGEYFRVEPTTTEQVRAAVRQAGEHGLPIRVRGNGHALNGSAVPRSGELLLLTGGLDYYRFEREGTVTVGAGSAVWDLNLMLEKFGYELPVYDQYGPASSVGGFISAGGTGLQSAQVGGFWESVTEITLITCAGERRTLRPYDENFRWLFGSMGQLGVIAEATLTIVAQGDASPAYPLGSAGRVPHTPMSSARELWFQAFVPGELENEARSAIRKMWLPHRRIFARAHPPFVRPIRFRTFIPPLLSAHRGDLSLVGFFGELPEIGFDFGRFHELGNEFSAWTDSDPRLRRYLPAEMLFDDFDFTAHYGETTIRHFAMLKRKYDASESLGRGPLADALHSVPPAPTMVEYGEYSLRALCDAAGFTDRTPEILDAYRQLSRSWGERRIDRSPLWSCATADSTPLELSMELEHRPTSVRVAVEAQNDRNTAASYWASAKDATQWLGEGPGLPLKRARAVEDLFAPGAGHKPGSMVAFHAMGWRRQGPPAGKIYFWAEGRELREALDRLGVANQWERLADALHPQDWIPYLSLDLAAGGRERIKVYVQHGGEPMPVERLHRVGELAADYVPEDGETVARLVARASARSTWPAGTSRQDRLEWRSNQRRHWHVDTYLSLTPDGIESAQHQIGLPALVRSDAEAADLVREVLDEYGIGPESRAAYERCLAAFTRGPLETERYAHTFLSAQRRPGRSSRVVVYFNPRMYLAQHGLVSGDLNRYWHWARG